MRAIIEFLATPWLATIIAIISVIAAVFFYVRSKRVKRLAYQLGEITVVGGSNAAFPKEVKIQFEGRKVDCVTVSRVVLWNAGNVTINGSEIVASDPLRLQLTADGEILKVDILKVSREVNEIRLLPKNDSRNIVSVVFDYLDPNDGATLQVLHSATRGGIICEGTIRGLLGGVSNYGTAPLERYSARNLHSVLGLIVNRRIFLWIMLVVGVVSILVGLLEPIWFREFPSFAISTAQTPAQLRWMVMVVGAFYALLPAVVLWLRRRRYPSALDPKPADVKRAK